MREDSLLFHRFLVVISLTLLFSLPSCVKENVISDVVWNQAAQVSDFPENVRWANAIVTVRRSFSGRNYFQLEDGVTLEPIGWDNPYSGEVRALVAYSGLDRESDFCTKAITVERIDSIETRDAVYIDIDDGLSGGSSFPVTPVSTGFDSVSEMLNASSPVDVVTNEGIPDWMTFSEDGYMMVHFATFWGDVTRHSVNLYASRKHPDHLYLVHKDNGDFQSSWNESLVAFRICQLYMSRKDEYSGPTSVVLHWMSFSGEKTLRLRYGNRAVEQ